MPVSPSTDVPAEAPSSAPLVTTIPAYDIVSVDDVSAAGVERYRVKVHVDKVLTSDELQSASSSILKELTPTKTVDALDIFFYLRSSDVEGAYTAGNAVWAAYGDWGRATEVQSGDHSHNEWAMFPIS